MSGHVEKSSGIAVPGGGIPLLWRSCRGHAPGLHKGQAVGEPGEVPSGKAVSRACSAASAARRLAAFQVEHAPPGSTACGRGFWRSRPKAVGLQEDVDQDDQLARHGHQDPLGFLAPRPKPMAEGPSGARRPVRI